jgi:hypothetical protein
VTDRDSLISNFAENSKSVLCSAAFGAGAYAIGGRLLGLAPLNPPAALVTAAALLGALTLCPANANSGDIFGQPPPFLGGQCPTQYRVRMQITYTDGSSEYPEQIVYGRIKGFEFIDPPGSQSFGLYLICGTSSDPSARSHLPIYLGSPASLQGFSIVSLSRVDGLPDNCGSLPNSNGQVISNTMTGDTIDNSKVVNNQDYSIVIPVMVDVGGVSNTLNVNFGPIVIGSLLPLTFNIDIGGTNFKFREKPDGELEPVETNPDEDLPVSKIEKLLSDIKGCVCKPEVDLDLLYLPVVDSSASCDIRSASFLVPKGSVNDSLVDMFVSSSVLASEACEKVVPAQLPESQIFAATVTVGGAEVFTGLIGNEVISLRVKITAYDEGILPQISSYPDSNQRKFGSVSYVGPSVEGGGDYIYVFDTDTYIPLPRRGKKGRLRILFKPGTSFQVFDTGERI